MTKENLEKLNNLLQEWDGCDAQINSYYDDHDRLTIALIKPGTTQIDWGENKGCVGITLLYCGYLSGPTRWKNCKLRCKKRKFTNELFDPDNEIEGYELFDEASQFIAHCYDQINYGGGELYVPDRR
jgi:hypothetical protein